LVSGYNLGVLGRTAFEAAVTRVLALCAGLPN
jgi:hypothetical protein